jgi:hypothetical protein
MKVKIGWACSSNGEENAFRFVVELPLGKRQAGKLGTRWEYNFKWILQKFLRMVDG